MVGGGIGVSMVKVAITAKILRWYTDWHRYSIEFPGKLSSPVGKKLSKN